MMVASVNKEEVEKFSSIADEWWDPHGKFKPLHQYNPLRVDYITHTLEKVKGLRVLDIGCGGGILSESMAALGAKMVGVDPSPENIQIAQQHAAQSGLKIDYRATTAENLAASKEKFGAILCMEVLEHVDNPAAFLAAIASMLKKGGHLFFSTINRTPQSYLLAIVGAEYVLNLLPKGTHQYEKFIKPSELKHDLTNARLALKEAVGVRYTPLTGSFARTRSLAVNYMGCATKI